MNPFKVTPFSEYQLEHGPYCDVPESRQSASDTALCPGFFLFFLFIPLLVWALSFGDWGEAEDEHEDKAEDEHEDEDENEDEDEVDMEAMENYFDLSR